MLEYAFPWALVALPLPVLVIWLVPPRREVVRAVRVPWFEASAAGLDVGEGAVILRRSPWQMALVWALWLLAVAMMARPEWVGDPIEHKETARDVMLAVDISGSMNTHDFVGPDGSTGTRLDGVKSVLADFIASRRDDRVGLIVFGSAPYVLVPFTQDTRAAGELLATLTPGMAGQNTMLGDAIGLAIRSFEASEVEARILIVLSDGTDTGSRMAPAKAADIAAQNGVTIFTIALGDPDSTDDADRVDVATLQSIATTTGGTFHLASDAENLADIYAQIDAAGAREGASTYWRPRTPLHWLAAAAFVGLVILAYGGAILVAAFRRRGRAAVTA